MAAKRAKADADTDDTVVIKKYANRRLYNTASSAYVTLDDLRKMVQQDVEFRVTDAKTDEDLTRAVLTQIIVEEESKGQNLLPISFLRQIISMYEDNMRWTLPQYLETVMGWYGRNQQDLQQQFNQSIGGMLPPAVEELQRSQKAFFENAMRMFNPLAPGEPGSDNTPPKPEAPPEKAEGDDLDNLRNQINALQKAVESLAKRGS
jgi:polyhydroxyalkanoate synthesis repressor PhaR